MAEVVAWVDCPSLPAGPQGRMRTVALELAVRAGEITAVWGPSASGKSALARAMATAATVRCATIPTDPYLAFDGILGSVAGELRWTAQRWGRVLSKGDQAALLQSARLTQAADQSVWTLSGGEAVRLALVKAQAGRAELLILDNVFAALDAASRALVIETLVEETRRGTAVLVLNTSSPGLRGLLPLAAEFELPGSAIGPGPAVDRWTGEYADLSLTVPTTLRLRDLRYGYSGGDEFHLAEADLEGGRCYVSTAPNGSGKTTFFRALSGMIPLRSGEMRLGQRRLGSRQARQARSFVQTQDAQYQINGRSVREEIVAVARGAPPRLAEWALAAADDLLGEGIAEINPFSLPRPYQRLLILLLACVSRRSVLMFDEPTAGLDDSLTGVATGLLKAAAAGQRHVLVATHAPEFGRSLLAEPLPTGLRTGQAGDEGRRETHL